LPLSAQLGISDGNESSFSSRVWGGDQIMMLNAVPLHCKRQSETLTHANRLCCRAISPASKSRPTSIGHEAVQSRIIASDATSSCLTLSKNRPARALKLGIQVIMPRESCCVPLSVPPVRLNPEAVIKNFREASLQVPRNPLPAHETPA
jgi:hypothetical protein